MIRAKRKGITGRGAKITISLLMLASLVVLALSSAGLLWKKNPIETTLPTSSGTIETSATTTAETTPLVLQALPINIIDPEPTPATGLRRWPAELCLPVVHQVDLTAYTGRKADEKPLDGITVILDPGHGGQDGGTVFPNKSNSPEIIEKNVTLDVSIKVRDLLESMGATVFMIRDTDEWLSVYCRIAVASRYMLDRFAAELPEQGYKTDALDGLRLKLDEMISINSDTESSGGRGLLLGAGLSPDARLLFDIQAQYSDTLFISLHCNSLDSDKRVRGAQVYYLTTEANYREESSGFQYVDSSSNNPVYTFFDDAGRQKLATGLRDSILQQLPDFKFGGESDLLVANYAILREMNLVSALVEMGFVTNDTDRQTLIDPAGQQKIAQSVADAVYNYYCG